jgi:signal transduction histidine kinase
MGMTMVFVPYEFGASAFRHVHPHLRLMGASFMVGSAAFLVAQLYPGRPAWLGVAGRTLFLGTLAAYWWRVGVLGGGATGALVYPLMAAGLLVEALPRWRARGFLQPFLAAVAAAFGGNMLLQPRAYGAAMYQSLQGVLQPVGLAYLAAAVLLGAAQLRPGWARAGRGALVLLGLLFAQMALSLGRARAWTGMELYATLGIACLVELVGPGRLSRPSGVRWRLLRGIALASVLPLLALGALAAVVSQRAIERELHTEARLAASAEASWLEERLRAARATLRSEGANAVLAREVLAGDAPALAARLARLEAYAGAFDAAWVLDARGETLATSPALAGVSGNFSRRAYFREADRPDEVVLSEPFMGAVGRPFVVLVTPVFREGRRVGVLGVGVDLGRLARARSLASERYHVRVVDRRGGRVLRDTGGGPLLEPAALAAPVGGADAVTEAFSTDGELLLQAHAHLSEAPWVVVVTAGLRDAYAPVTRLGLSVVLLALVAGVLALLLSRWVGRDVASRVEALRDGFAALEAGSAAGPEGAVGAVGAGAVRVAAGAPGPAAEGDDELAQLTQGFDHMAARIARSQAELRAAVAVREQFLSIASHELRTPLTPLRACMEVLLRQVDSGRPPEPERTRATLQRGLRQVDRLTRLVGDMLDVTRLQAGRFTLQRTRVDLAGLAREVVERVRQSPAGAAAALHLEVPGGGAVVGSWDEQRLEQVLTNLVENALRYSPPPARVRVHVRQEGAGAVLEVQDAGIGVPAESLGRLFTPFFRADNAAAHHAGGVGLGLSICREIVERHGGRIEVHSEGAHRGTLFRVHLPAGGALPQETGPQAPLQQAG